MRRNGGDAKIVQLTEFPFPQMADAPMQDRLDAVWAADTILKKSGEVRVIGYPYQENIPNMDITAMFAKESLLKANADAAKRFELGSRPRARGLARRDARRFDHVTLTRGAAALAVATSTLAVPFRPEASSSHTTR